MDAVDQIFAQARLGSAGGKGIESESLQGWVSLGQQNRRLALDEEEAAQTRQTRAMARDIFEKFRALKTTEERLNFIGSLAPLTLTRGGAALVDVLQSVTDKFEAIESQTMGRQAQLAERKRAFDQIMRYGFTGPEATKRDEITALEKEVAALGGNPASLTYDDSLFNEKGYFLSPGTRQRLKSMAEPSLNLQQREEDSLIRLQIAEDRLGLLRAQVEAKGDGFVPSESGKKAAEYERAVGRPLTEEERGIFYGLKARPGVTHEMLREEYIQKKLEAFLRGSEGMNKTRQQAIDALGKEFDANFAAPARSVEAPGVQDNYDRFKLWLEKKK